jgi:Zinc finger, C2H2 type
MDSFNVLLHDLLQPLPTEELDAFPLLAGTATEEAALQGFTSPFDEFVNPDMFVATGNEEAVQPVFTGPIDAFAEFALPSSMGHDEAVQQFNADMEEIMEIDMLPPMEDEETALQEFTAPIDEFVNLRMFENEEALQPLITPPIGNFRFNLFPATVDGEEVLQPFTPPATQSPPAPKADKTPLGRTPCSFAGCDKDFCNAQVMRKHVDSVHNGRKHSCEEPGCGKTFTDERNLRRHRAKHSVGATQRVCPHCSKSFPAARSDNFKRHVTSTCPNRNK